MEGYIALGVIAFVYFLPTVVACLRRHHNENAIGALNILAGWTVIGWVVAMVWAFTARRSPG